ncbi:hypothetical protein GBA52_004221 [Prunus armeniaca]|nr:hypothetical protein GBA52_004221 [Prunus armeniaca]
MDVISGGDVVGVIEGASPPQDSGTFGDADLGIGEGESDGETAAWSRHQQVGQWWKREKHGADHEQHDPEQIEDQFRYVK